MERDAALRLGLLQVRDGGEVAVGQRGVGEPPQVLGRVELGRVGRQEEQMEMLGHLELGAGMPARAVQDEHDLFARPSAHRLGEGRQLSREQFDAHARRQIPDGAAGGGVDEARQIAPLVAMVDRGQRALAGEGPDALPDRFQANAVLVSRPELDLGLREGGSDLAEQRAEPP
jgi:hypothetical protein